MKKSWIIRVFWGTLMLGMAMGAKAQVADMRVGELLNSSDWFTLEKEYPLLKDSVQTPLLGLMSEACWAIISIARTKHWHAWIRCCGIIRKSLDWTISRRC